MSKRLFLRFSSSRRINIIPIFAGIAVWSLLPAVSMTHAQQNGPSKQGTWSSDDANDEGRPGQPPDDMGGPGGPPPDDAGGPGGPPPDGFGGGNGPGGPPPNGFGGPGGVPPGGFGKQGARGGGPGVPGGPGMNSSSCKLVGVYTVTGKTERSKGKRYTSSAKDTSAIYVKNGGNLTLIDPTVVTSGNTSSDDSSSFFGLNAAVLATTNSKISISGGTVTSSGTGANGVFAVGKGTSISLTNLKIAAAGNGAHGVMATLGGSLTMKNVDIITQRERAGAIATDRGSGTIKAVGGKIVTYGTGSPGIYSTGEITVVGAEIDAHGAEGGVIEGSNSITLEDTVVTSRRLCGVMIYQSFSGDAQGRKGVLTIKGGQFDVKAGPIFYVTNTNAVITVENAKLSSTSGVLLKAAIGRWGRQGSNGGHARMTADNQSLEGNVECDANSSILLTLQNHSTLSGAVNGASLSFDATSQWNVTDNSTVAGLSITVKGSSSAVKCIHSNGHVVEYDASNTANRWLSGKTYRLAGGGKLKPIGKSK